MLKFSIAGILLLPIAGLAASTGGSTCENLSKLNLPHVTVNSAETVAAGAFTPPAAPGPFGPNMSLFHGLPAWPRTRFIELSRTADPAGVRAVEVPGGELNSRQSQKLSGLLYCSSR